MCSAGYLARDRMYRHMTYYEWFEMLEGEDPDDRAIREAHGIGYEVPCNGNVKCFNGCGLSYLEIASGKIRTCTRASKVH